ncbi:MAG: 5'/3'-nucleotidase SurE [Desulfobulbaceae bacterium]|nr:5'/3'-nucleotidase SurE [Desulfobulbaceae bacterium]
MSTPPYILVTNDDGVHSPGLIALHQAMMSLGRAVVVAPERDNSAVSHSLTMDRPLRVRTLKDDIHTLDGTPTDCVTIGMNKVLENKPDLLVSGINPGSNLGDDISYSGTVSAAIEATMYGIPSLAISAAGNGEHDFAAAAMVAGHIAKMVLLHGLPDNTLLNVNIPPGPDTDLSRIRFTRQGRRLYKNPIQETFDPWGRKYYWIGGGTVHWSDEEGSDEHAVRGGYISVTPIQLDLTNHAGLAYLKKKWQW